MSGLFIRLFLDEDVDVLVAEMVRAHGFDAQTTREAGRLGESDAAQLEFATAEGQVFLTHNRVHFERLVEENFHDGRDHAGVFFAARRLPGEIVRRLLIILNTVTADEMKNQVRYL
jgi:hypothetical protein